MSRVYLDQTRANAERIYGSDANADPAIRPPAWLSPDARGQRDLRPFLYSGIADSPTHHSPRHSRCDRGARGWDGFEWYPDDRPVGAWDRSGCDRPRVTSLRRRNPLPHRRLPGARSP